MKATLAEKSKDELMPERHPGSVRWVLARAAIVTGITIAIGFLIALLFGLRSPKAFSNIYFILGGLLVVLGFLDVMNSKGRLADYSYQLSRSTGAMSLDHRTRSDIEELHHSYSGLILLAISLSANMGETLTPPEFNVEGGEGILIDE